MTICNQPGCPDPAVHRGRCRRHRQSEAQRGYGAEHRRDRRVNRPGARCAACGCTKDLQRNHIVPVSMGGTEDPANKEWLCDCPDHRCHSRLGLKSSTRHRLEYGTITDGVTTHVADPSRIAS